MLLLMTLGLVGSPLPGQPPAGVIEPFDNAVDLYHRANNLYEFGETARTLEDKRNAFTLSIPLYREYLTQSPTGKFAQESAYKLGMALLLTGERETAERSFQALIKRYRTGHWVAWSAYRQAAQLYNRRAWNQAAPYFALAVKEATEEDLAHRSIFYEARCLRYAERNDEALKKLKEIINDHRNPFRDFARLSMGEVHAAKGDHEDALKNFELLLAPTIAPQERAKALLAAGVSASKLGQPEKAETFLNRTLDSPGLDPKFKAKAQLALMEMCFEEKNLRKVVKVLRRGEYLADRDTMSKIYLLGGKALAHLDRHKEAIRQFYNAERLSPLTDLGFESSYRRLVSFYKIDDPNIPGQVDAFLKIYAERYRASKEIHEARLMKAEILFHQGKLDLASQAYNDINASALPEDSRADVYFKRGWCLADSGEFGRATQNLSSFIADNPEHQLMTDALSKRGNCYLELGDRASALKDFDRVLSTPNTDPSLVAYALQNCGRIRREERKWAAMIGYYQKLLDSTLPLDTRTKADTNYWIGWGWYKQEKWAKAIPYFQIARDLSPERYREAAGINLILASYSLLDSDKLQDAVDRLRADAPNQRMPTRMLIWLGLERFSKGDYKGADRALNLAAIPEEPAATDIIVWRHLAKAQIEIKHYDRALKTIEILLTQDQEDFWKADAQLDRSHALIGTEKWKEAREAALLGLDLDAQGTVKAGLYMTLADVAMHRKDYDSAATSYLRTSEMFIDDKEIKPLALYRAAEAMEKGGQSEEAAEIRKKLRQEFPSWTAATGR